MSRDARIHLALALVCQFLTGWRALDAELELDGAVAPSVVGYFSTGHFISAVFENWAAHRLPAPGGSPESKPVAGEEGEDIDPQAWVEPASICASAARRNRNRSLPPSIGTRSSGRAAGSPAAVFP